MHVRVQRVLLMLHEYDKTKSFNSQKVGLLTFAVAVAVTQKGPRRLRQS